MLSCTEVRKDILVPNDFFWQIISAHRGKQIDVHTFNNLPILAIDPGETTGFAIWDPEKGQVELTQWETKDVGTTYGLFEDYVELYKPQHVRVEEYRIYNWMADQHSWSILHTPQLIGALKVLAAQHNLEMSFKLAQHAKAMWTDDNLKKCNLYSPGMKHARDASRHLFFYMAKPTNHD